MFQCSYSSLCITFYFSPVSTSDAPDDYIALRDLKENKNNVKDKYRVKDEWVMPFEVIPIIEIEGFGNQAAVTVSNELKIKNQHDTAKLALAKEKTYLKVSYTCIRILSA